MTFEQDLLGRKEFCKRLEKFLEVEKDYVEGSLVVALNGRFGSGKSALIEMWHNDIATRRGEGEWCPMPVILNAWESDHCGDPMIAILSGLIGAAERWAKPKPEAGKLKKAAKDVLWFSVGLANSFVSKVGIDPVAAGEFAEGKKSAEATPPDFIKVFGQRLEAMRTLKARLAQTFGGETCKAIVFVDELDRCRPDYAITYLETIKHVFDVRGIIFVLAIDYNHLKNSACALFGSDLDPAGYFSKFFHRTFELEMNEATHSGLVGPYFSRYLSVEGKRLCGWRNSRDSIVPLEALVKGLRMTPRQIQESFRILGHALSTANEEVQGHLKWAIPPGLAFLSFLKVGRPSLYRDMMRRESKHKEVLQLIHDFGEDANIKWWSDLYLTGIFDPNSGHQIREFLMGETGASAEEAASTAGAFYEGWGRIGRIPDLCKMIEEARSF